MAHPQEWLKVTSTGLYCAPGDFYIDPALPVERAVVTHGHSDHARPGHRQVLATAGTLTIMGARFGAEAATRTQAAAYGESVRIGEVSVRLAPAGHVLGSAQVVLEHGGSGAEVAYDLKRDTAGKYYLGGYTLSRDLPVTIDAPNPGSKPCCPAQAPTAAKPLRTYWRSR
jgi:L-ascorbate metabolism protein UlaG (beta-lactamase superfamily)